jgi:hypothetical protein
MYKFGVLLSLFAGVVAYLHVTEDMMLAHETGVAVGLLTSVISMAVVWAYASGSGLSLTRDDRWAYKHKAHKRSRNGGK